MYGQFVSSAHLQDKLWIRRYVDNRAILVEDQELRTNPYIQQLASLNFYKKPVQLEDENNDNFLGFTINADNRQVRYILHEEFWRYRLPQSAGSMRLRLSGYHSRKHLVKATTFPKIVTHQQETDLDELYHTLGFTDLESPAR